MTNPLPVSHHDRPRRLLLACFPRSGSTFLASILASLPGFQKVSLVPDYGRREQELALELLATAQATCGHFVAQHHVRYSRETQRLMDLFCLQAIILVRNIFDVAVSIRDHIRSGGIVFAQAYVPLAVPKWKEERLDQFIADLILPWYFNFYSSWTDCPARVQVTYEEVATEPAATVRRIRDRLNLEATDSQVRKAIQQASALGSATRLNVGVCGRGSELTPSVRARILELASYYRNLDLSSIGLSEGQNCE